MPAAVSTRRIVRRPQLESDTPLVALAAARSVLDEAAVLVGQPLPARFAARLAHRARRVYGHSDSFRRKLRARGDSGREWLHVFLRHWLAALLRDESPTLFARLPAAFANGSPCALSAAVHPTEHPSPKTRRSLPRS
ncbi:MAG TPA: hypothetical protein VK163_17165 [Opitutaceae bacterium]|nr:hypothetical protein [Opitutaceae bacterium]